MPKDSNITAPTNALSEDATIQRVVRLTLHLSEAELRKALPRLFRRNMPKIDEIDIVDFRIHVTRRQVKGGAR